MHTAATAHTAAAMAAAAAALLQESGQTRACLLQ
jgi:hypothetical protein